MERYKPGKEFDKDYVPVMIKDHKQDIKTLKLQLRNYVIPISRDSPVLTYPF